MTAPSPGQDVTVLLAELEAAREKALPGEWTEADVHAANRDDAALIVAAVNSLPALTAALRAALDLADEYEELAGHAYDRPDWRARLVADRIRAAIATALGDPDR